MKLANFTVELIDVDNIMIESGISHLVKNPQFVLCRQFYLRFLIKIHALYPGLVLPAMNQLAKEVGLSDKTTRKYIQDLKRNDCWPFTVVYPRKKYSRATPPARGNQYTDPYIEMIETRVKAARRAKKAKFGLQLTDEDIEKHIYIKAV